MKKTLINSILLLTLSTSSFWANATIFVVACFDADGKKILSDAKSEKLGNTILGKANSMDCVLVNSINYNTSAAASFGKGAGASVGRPEFGPLVINKNIDLLSPYLFLRSASGKFFNSVNIFFMNDFNNQAFPLDLARQPLGNYQPSINNATTVMMIQIGRAFITSVKNSANTGNVDLSETIELVYEKIKLSMASVDDNGVRINGSAVIQGWDMSRNQSFSNDPTIPELFPK